MVLQCPVVHVIAACTTGQFLFWSHMHAHLFVALIAAAADGAHFSAERAICLQCHHFVMTYFSYEAMVRRIPVRWGPERSRAELYLKFYYYLRHWKILYYGTTVRTTDYLANQQKTWATILVCFECFGLCVETLWLLRSSDGWGSLWNEVWSLISGYDDLELKSE